MYTPNQKFISARELATYGVPYSVVLEACQDGTLNAQRLGPAFAIDEQVAMAWVKKYKELHDPNGVLPLKRRIKDLESQVAELSKALARQQQGA